MKIAIIGSGLIGTSAAKHFYDLGAEIKLFSSSDKLGGLLNIENNLLRVNDIILQKIRSDEKTLRDSGLVKKGRVLRLHKRFLPPCSKALASSRFADLFRVVYQIDAKEQIEQNRDENEELFKNLDDTIIESLKTSIEAYEDFDVVLDCTGSFSHPLPMGAGGALALNEKVIMDDERVAYGKDVLSKVKSIDGQRNIVFIGTGEFNLLALNEFRKKFFSDKRINLHFVCTDSVPFENVSPKFADAFRGVHEFIEESNKEYQDEIDIFNKKILEWKELENHIRLKTPKPTEPRMRLSIYNGAVVSSVDKLLDREGLFVTIEGSELLGSFEKLMTLSCDTILVDNGQRSSENFDAVIDDNEVGFFKLKTLDDIQIVESELMKLFSKGSEQ